MHRAKRKLAILAIIVAALAATEVFLRNFNPQQTAYVPLGLPLYKEGDYFSWRLRAGVLEVNSLGYRGKKFGLEKGDATRILAIGDEATFGWGGFLEDSYPAQLETFLTERFPARRWQVINAGLTAGDAPDTYYLYLKREGLALNPDLILVGLFFRDDLDSDIASTHEWIEQDADGLPLRIRDADSAVAGNHLVPRRLPFRYRAPLLSRSHVFQRLVDIASPQTPSSSAEPAVPFIYRLTYADRTEFAFARVRKLLGAMNKMAQAHGIPLYVLMIPERPQMDRRAFAGREADIEKPHRVLREFFDRDGIKFVDLLAPLREASGGRSIHLERWSVPDPSGVPDALGNYLIVEHTAGVLAKEWIPQIAHSLESAGPTGNAALSVRRHVMEEAGEDETGRRLRRDSTR